MSDSRLQGKTAIVAGGGRGIGAAIAVGLARQGANVAVTYAANQDAAEDTAEAVRAAGSRALAIQADSRDRAMVGAMVTRTAEALGPVDILVNNAGTQQRIPFLDIPDDAWREIFSVNVDGLFVMGQEVARTMVAAGNGGSIVSVTSVAQSQVAPNMTVYNASKAAAFALTRQMAYELAPHGIRVNCLAPGLTETDLNRQDLADETFRAQRLGRIPLGYIAEPEDQVAAAVFLVSDEARYVTGACLGVDGGADLTGPPAIPLR